MLRNTLRATLLAATGIALALPLYAQSSIRPGQTVRGTLTSSDPKAEDDSHFDTWTYAGPAGQPIVITLRSSEFDAFLGWGQMTGGDWRSIESDDDGDGGTDARLQVTPDGNGTYSIRVNTLSAGETGAYTLAVTPAGSARPVATRPEPSGVAGTIRDGQTVRGRLDPSDPKASDDSYFEAWSYQGRAGERLLITLRSSEFDAYLNVGETSGGGFESIEADDDGDGGTDARVRITLPRTGTYTFRANTLVAGETGAYTLSVARQ